MVSGLVSIIMPVYNAEAYLSAAISSILNQSYINFELIILNDASTDRSGEIIRSFEDKRIRYYEYADNEGYVVRLNHGLGYSKGEYVARMDSDDVCSPDRLLKQVTFLSQNSKLALCGTYFKIISSHGKVIGSIKKYSSHNLIRFKLLFSNPICHPSVMFKRNVLEQVGLYDEKKKPAEDYDLWTRIIQSHEIENIPEFLFYYRVHLNSVSHLHGIEQKERAFDSGINYFEKVLRFKISSQYYDFFLLRDYKYYYSSKDLAAIKEILIKVADLMMTNELKSWEYRLIKEELSLFYLHLWSKRIRVVSNFLKGLTLLLSTFPFDKKSICFKEASLILFSTGRINKSISFGLIALLKDPLDKYNYYLLINSIKALFSKTA